MSAGEVTSVVTAMGSRNRIVVPGSLAPTPLFDVGSDAPVDVTDDEHDPLAELEAEMEEDETEDEPEVGDNGRKPTA